MMNAATILLEAEAKLTKAIGVPVRLSMSLASHPVEPAKPHEWIPPVQDSKENQLLITTVCEEFGVSKDLFRAPSKKGAVVDARKTYLYLGSKLLRLSPAEMCLHTGRHRTTALDQLQKAKDEIDLMQTRLGDRVKHVEKQFIALNQDQK